MTCVVGVRCEGGVLLGSDCCRALDRFRRGKLFSICPLDRVGVGVSGFARTGQLIGLGLQVGPDLNDDAYRWAHETFVPALSKHLRANGREMDSTLLLAVGDRLLRVNEDFSVHETPDAFDAVGSGGEIALGALHAMYGGGPFRRLDVVLPRDVATRRAERALRAASRYDDAVREPFEFLEIRRL